MQKMKWLIAAAILLAGAPLAEQAQAQTPATSSAKSPAQSKAGTVARHSAPVRPYDRMLLRPPLLKAQAPASYQVKFTTTRGEFIVSVTRAWAPIGADRFYNLVRHHFYDTASFFRVVPGFVVQFGLSAYPPVSAAWKSMDLRDDPVTQSNKAGFLTFATAGPNTRTTQVFINLVDNPRLDRMGFAPFAQVTSGMNVVQMLYDQYGDSGAPDQDLIEKQGKPYIDKGWPKLDSIKTATLVVPPGARPAKAASSATKPR